MLILQGERDYQVTQADLEGWRCALRGRRDVTIKSYPTLNHLVMVIFVRYKDKACRGTDRSRRQLS